jgi:endonuclease III
MKANISVIAFQGQVLTEYFRISQVIYFCYDSYMDRSQDVKHVYKLLKKAYPKAISFLEYESPFHLLIAVILSAQTTDAQVNKVTPLLFGKYSNPAELMEADIAEVEKIIKSTGFYKVKAKNITRAAKTLVLNFNSKVPIFMEDLLTIEGVGRKSANVVRAHCYNKPAIIVDTHFSRVTGRLGFTDSSDPKIIESDLLLITNKKIQTDFSMMINIHGRKICTARKPLCMECTISEICKYAANLYL